VLHRPPHDAAADRGLLRDYNPRSLEMNRNYLVATAVALAAGFACNANAANLTPPAGNIFPVGGATATDKSLAIGWLTDLCDAATTPGGIEVFTTRANFLPGTVQNYAIACRMKTTANGAAAGQDVIMLKYSGGSGTGVQPVANNTTLVASGSASWVDYAACATAPVPGTVNGVNYTVRQSCPVFAAGYVPKAGVSDTEPALLGGAGLALTSAPAAAVPFGVLVNQNFFEALQNAQPAIPGSCTGLVGSYTPECTPSLSKEVIRGIFKGTILTVASLRDQAGVAIPAPAGSPLLNVCRRGDNSGTMASFKAYWLGQGCGGLGNQHTFVAPTNAASAPSGAAYTIGNLDRVFAGTGNGDVLACVDDKMTQNKYAVGIASLETTSFSDAAPSRWRFIKIDGAFPSLESVARAEYDFFTESACNRPSAASANTLSTVQAALASGTVVGGTQTATGLCGAVRGDAVGVNPSGSFAWAMGTMTIPASTAVCPTLPVSNASILANPTNSATRAVSFGGAPNNCNLTWTACPTVVVQDVASP
jgi:hypothetical protein